MKTIRLRAALELSNLLKVKFVITKKKKEKTNGIRLKVSYLNVRVQIESSRKLFVENVNYLHKLEYCLVFVFQT